MNNQKHIEDFIILPFVLTIFKKDRPAFSNFKFYYLYDDFFEQLIKQVKMDIVNNKQLMYSKLKIDVRMIERSKEVVRYRVKSRDSEQVICYTPDQLKEMTSERMTEYLLKKGLNEHEKQTI